MEREDLQNRISLELPKPGNKWISPTAAKDTFDLKNNDILSRNLFCELPISSVTLRTLEHQRHDRMTLIQAASLPHSLAGTDVIGEAPTGSGKTLAYVIPILEKLWHEGIEAEMGLYVLVLTPTRELTQQVFDVMSKFKGHQASAMACYGGKFISKESPILGKANICIGTPGRIKQHMECTYSFRLDNVSLVVLDEVDKLIEFGFLEDVTQILSSLPDDRQTLMFSATMPNAVRKLANKFCRKKLLETISTSEVNKSPVNLVQAYCVVPLEKKVSVLYSFLCRNYKHKIIVFVNTIKESRFLFETFKDLNTGSQLLEIHSGQDMGKRLEIYDKFTVKKAGITLFATDLVGRGVDFPQVDWVVLFDCPPDADCYIHRTGRTARGIETQGCSVVFLTPHETTFIDRIKEKKIPIKEVKIQADKSFSITGKLGALLAKK